MTLIFNHLSCRMFRVGGPACHTKSHSIKFNCVGGYTNDEFKLIVLQHFNVQLDTAAQLTGKYDKDEVVVNSSKLRRYATPLLDEEDKRYKGKQVSRQLLEDGSEDSLEGNIL